MEQFGFLNCKVEPGMFDSEFTVTISVQGTDITSTVDKQNVELDAADGQGRVLVKVLEQNGDRTLVALPQPAFTSTPRFYVPARQILQPA